MVVWSLQYGSGFTAFEFTCDEDMAHFHNEMKAYFEESNSISGNWKPLYMLRCEPKKHADFFQIGESDVIAISQKAADCFSMIINNAVELLPIETDAGKFYALNVLNFVDCLDINQSKYVAAKDGTIVNYSLLEFFEDKLKGHSIFKIPQLPYQIFVNHEIEDICEVHNLKGLSFDPDTNLIWYPE